MRMRGDQTTYCETVKIPGNLKRSAQTACTHTAGLQDTREAADLHGNYSLPLHTGAMSCVGYVADLNATVTCGMDGKIHFFDLTKRRITRTFRGHVDRPVFAFAYSKR